MLVSITEKCRMGCSHCMDDALPDCENHMSMEMFIKAIDFNFKYDKTITITGGEPTENPLFWHMMNVLAEKMTSYQVATVTTNGMNFSNDDIDKIISIRNKCAGKILYQVSAIRPYYPIHIDERLDVFKLPEVFLAKKLEKLECRGRATQHQNWIFTAKAPQCFNIRSTIRSTKNFESSIQLLRIRAHFCTPQIAYDGSIKCGESCLCPPVAHIDENIDIITDKISKFTCACPDCHMTLDKLPLNYREAIGEK